MLSVGSAFPSAVFADGLPLSEKSSVLTAPTAETAAALAAQTGQPVEVTGALSKTSATFINPDGSRTVDLALGPVRELDPSSVSGWSSINTTLTADRTGLHPTLADVPETFSDGGADGFLAKLGLGADQLTLGWLDSLPVPVVEGNQATYRDVYPGVDLVLQARPQGFEQLWVVRERPTGPLVFTIPLGLKGLSATTSADGSLVLTDTRTGEVKAQSDTARMWGAELDPNADEPTYAAQVPTSVVAAGSGYALEIRPDPSFLNDPAVTYPVTIDPVVNLLKSVDTYVQKGQASTNSTNETILKAGTYNGGSDWARTLMRWDVSPLAGAVVSAAQLSLHEYWSWSCTPSTLQLYRAAINFNANTRWSDTQYTTGAIYAATTDAKGWSSAGEGGASACPSARIYLATGGYAANIGLKDLVQYWADDPANNNYGAVIRAANETDSNGWKKFYSYDNASGNPILTVTYNHTPSVPAITAPLDGADLPRTFSATGTFSDADGGSGLVQFQLVDGSGAVVATSAASGSLIPSGTAKSATFSVTSDDVFSVQARSWDGTVWSAWSNPDDVIFSTNADPDHTDGDLNAVVSITPGGGAAIASSTPTLSATVRTLSVDRVAHADMTVYQRLVSGLDGAQVLSLSGDDVASGYSSGFAVPAGLLAPGNSYNVHASIVQDDGVVVAQVSDWFSVATAASATPVPQVSTSYATDPILAGMQDAADLVLAKDLQAQVLPADGPTLYARLQGGIRGDSLKIWNADHEAAVVGSRVEVWGTTPPAGYTRACLRQLATERKWTVVKRGSRSGRNVGYMDIVARFIGCGGVPDTEFVWEVKPSTLPKSVGEQQLVRYIRARQRQLGPSVTVLAGYQLNGGVDYYMPSVYGGEISIWTRLPTAGGRPPYIAFGLIQYRKWGGYQPNGSVIEFVPVTSTVRAAPAPELAPAGVQNDANLVNLSNAHWVTDWALIAEMAINSVKCGELAPLCFGATMAVAAAATP